MESTWWQFLIIHPVCSECCNNYPKAILFVPDLLVQLSTLCSNIIGLLTNSCFPSIPSWLPSLLGLVLHIPQTIFHDLSLSPFQPPSIFRRAVTETALTLPGTETLDSRHMPDTESLMVDAGLLPWGNGPSSCRQPSIIGSTWALGSAGLNLNPRLLLTMGPWASYWVPWASTSLSAETRHTCLMKRWRAWLSGFKSQLCQLCALEWVT